MPKKKKTTASGELVLVKSVRRTRSRRMKFCVQRGLGALPSTSSLWLWIATSIACAYMFGFWDSIAHIRASFWFNPHAVMLI